VGYSSSSKLFKHSKALAQSRCLVGYTLHHAAIGKVWSHHIFQRARYTTFCQFLHIHSMWWNAPLISIANAFILLMFLASLQTYRIQSSQLFLFPKLYCLLL
jgi:hypothetical protein